MRAEGIDFEERKERLEDVSYPKPLEELLDEAFASYCEKVPWASDYALSPKSILRDMVESAADFKGYIARYNIQRSEGLLLRYLSDAFRVLVRTVPTSKLDEQLQDIVSWLRLTLRTVDSSLIDEWAGTESEELEAGAAPGSSAVVQDRHGLTVLVRNAFFRRVRLAARGDFETLGTMDKPFGWPQERWRAAIDAYYQAHDDVLLDSDARSMAYLLIDEADEQSAHVWHVRQIFHDPDGDNDFGIAADVLLDQTQEEGEVQLDHLRVGFIEELLDPEEG